jgi:nicotinamidase-related amidase
MSRALLVIDVQNEYFTGKLPITHPPGSLANILRAMDAAHEAGVQVILIQHTAPQPETTVFRRGSPEWELHPEIARRAHQVLIHKTLPGSFTGTELESWLRTHGVDSVAIAGYMTQMCCDTTARQAMHLGFKVEFLSDATGTLAIKNDAGLVTGEELHRATLVTQQMRFSRVLPTADWISALAEPVAAQPIKTRE